MSVLNSVVKLFTSENLRRIEHFMRHPREVQHEMYTMLMSSLASTHYGRDYGVTAGMKYQDFAQRVPIVTYEDLEDRIEKMRGGAANELWPGVTTWYARSSGTTGSKSKYIPVTDQYLEECHFQGGRDVLAVYFDLYPNSKLFRGKGLTLGGSQKSDMEMNGSHSGDLSAILLTRAPKWLGAVRTPSKKVALLSDWDEKIAGIAKETLSQNVTSLTGVPSWNMVMLKRMLEISGKRNLLELWPNLEVFFHGGMNFGPYRPQFEQLIPSPDMHYMENYNASEGYFALQNEPNDTAMLLMLDYGVFYEFIPMSEFANAQRRAIPLEDVKVGENYAVVISATNGLWRYLIGDTVTFTSTSPYKIRITGRTKHFINAFGEEVIIDNVETALAKACEAYGATVEEYTVAPHFMNLQERAAHEWFIEFEKEPSDVHAFMEMVDKTIQSLNSDYEAKRKNDVTLSFPMVHLLPPGTFYGWMEARGKFGGQNKVPRLSNDRTHVESLLEYLGQGKA